MEMQFKRAQRSRAKLRLGLSAVSGGGKTMGALRVAKGIVQRMIDLGVVEGDLEGKICVIDTERRSAQLYADVVPFDTLEFEPPYSVDRYMQAISAAERAGYVVCILDQITHAWAGPGGQLEWVDSLKQGAKNAMSPWAKVTPMQQEFYDRMLRSPMHIIATMRAKSDYVMDEVIVDGRRKTVPRKIGLAPVQREGIEYEFTAMLEIDLETHLATASKDRTRLFVDRTTKLDEDCGARLADWLLQGEEAPPEAPRKTEADFVFELDAKLADFELAFVECADLQALATLFPKANEAVKAYKDLVSHDAYQKALARLAKSKDDRKAALTPAGQVPPAASGAGSTPPTVITPEQVSEIRKLAQKYKMTDDDLRKLCAVESIETMPASVFEAACKMVETWGKKAKRADAGSKP